MKFDYSYSDKYPVRLTQRDIEAIQKCFKETFCPDDHLWVFGSRADLNKRGGDIDLYVETTLPLDEAFQKRGEFIVKLFQSLEEQKIDVIINYNGAPSLLVHQEALKTGIKLA